MNKKEYVIPILYTVLGLLFAILSYLFIYGGINTKSREYVKYQEDSSVEYRVFLKDNDIYNKEYLSMGQKYIASLVDYIDFDISYKSLFENDINGYYSYNALATLVVYEDNINDSLWEKEYQLLENKVMVLNENNVNYLDVLDRVTINYDDYYNELVKFTNDYGINVLGYLKINFNINTLLDFSSLDNDIEDSKKIEIIVPIVDDTFKIDLVNKYDNVDGYYYFSNKKVANYVFILCGIASLIISLIMIILLFREIKIIANRQSKYIRELKKILNEYGDKIVNVNRFYNKKKYNLIYVDSFSELIDVYNKVGTLINFREVKKNYRAVFLIIDDDNAWIYEMIANKNG